MKHNNPVVRLELFHQTSHAARSIRESSDRHDAARIASRAVARIDHAQSRGAISHEDAVSLRSLIACAQPLASDNENHGEAA